MARNEIRIIGGKWKGRKLRFADRPDLRPTLGRARETLFNWLATEIHGARCLDLFAGSGALGFEAASRGALAVDLVERDRQAAAALSRNAELLGGDQLAVRSGEAMRFLRTAGGCWDIVFLDPPFSGDALAKALPLLKGKLNDGALVYWEAPSPPLLPSWLEAFKQQRAGDTQFGLARFADAERLDYHPAS